MSSSLVSAFTAKIPMAVLIVAASKILAPNDTFSDGAPSLSSSSSSLKKQSMVYSMFVSALAGRFGSISLSSAVAKPSSEVVGIDCLNSGFPRVLSLLINPLRLARRMPWLVSVSLGSGAFWCCSFVTPILGAEGSGA